VDWSDPLNANSLQIKFKLFRCPSSPSGDGAVTPYATNYIAPGNDAFTPPSGAGSTINIFGKKVYPTIARPQRDGRRITPRSPR
jgi:hypothetical protein